MGGSVRPRPGLVAVWMLVIALRHREGAVATQTAARGAGVEFVADKCEGSGAAVALRAVVDGGQFARAEGFTYHFEAASFVFEEVHSERGENGK